MKTLGLAMIIVGFPAIVNAGDAASPSDLAGLVRRVETQGAGGLAEGPLAESLGLADGTYLKEIPVPPGGSADGWARSCMVAYERSEGKTAARPLALLFLAKDKDLRKGKGDALWLRLSLEGSLDRALRSVTRYDGNGRVVEGSGKVEVLDPSSRKARKLLRHELDFWLRGLHRSQAP